MPQTSEPAYRGQARVAFQGESGAFSELAAIQIWGPDLIFIPSATFADVLHAVATRVADYGVIPVDNTTIGPIPESREALAAHANLQTVNATVVAVRHCLLSLPGVTLDAIRQVLSHPAALAQCRSYLARHPHFMPVDFYDTAGAAREVGQRRDPNCAAIAGRHVADRFGLVVAAADIADSPDNFTRFVAVARQSTTRL